MFFYISVFYALQSLRDISLLEYEGLKYGKLIYFYMKHYYLRNFTKFHISYFLLIHPTSESHKHNIFETSSPSPSSEDIT